MARRAPMSGNVKAKLSLDPASYADFKRALKQLERAVRKEVIESALTAGGTIIHRAAQSRAPGKIEMQLIGGRTLRKRVDRKFSQVVKANAKLMAIGPDAAHWYYRFFEFGATRHDLRVKKAKALRFEGSDGIVFAKRAKQTGGVRMRPFLRPAVDGNKAAAVQAMGTVLRREIEKAARA